MASTTARKVNYAPRTYGSLAYDLDLRAREMSLTSSDAEFERRVHAEPILRPEPRAVPRTHAHSRSAIRVSAFSVVGTLAVGVLLVMILMSYVQLTAISSNVVSMRAELSALEEENMTLTTEYERIFDKASVTAAAEAAGMTKPSPSQIYYIDLSNPDTVVLYGEEETTLFGNIAETISRSFYSVVEYFN